MAAVRDPITGTAPPPVIRGEAPAVARHEAGRETARLYHRHAGTVYRYASQMLGDREDAEDATQATFLAVHAALAGGTVVREPQAWVLRIARNECLARIEARMRRPLTASLGDVMVGEVAAGAPSVPRAVELRSDLKAANDALGRLPAAQREAYLLREWLGLSTAEVAASLGTTVVAVESLLGRARRELVRALGAAGETGAAGCRRTGEALASGTLDRAARAHLVRCRSCRAVRRSLRAPGMAAPVLAPPAAIAKRLGATMPGFATAGAGSAVAGGAAGGGGVAALTAKLASGPAAMKGAAAALTAMAAIGGGVAVRHAAVHARPAHTVRVATRPAKARAAVAPGQASSVSGTPSSLAGSSRPGAVAPARAVRKRTAASTSGAVRAVHRAHHRAASAGAAVTAATIRHRHHGEITGSGHRDGDAPAQTGHHRGDGGSGRAHHGSEGQGDRAGGRTVQAEGPEHDTTGGSDRSDTRRNAGAGGHDLHGRASGHDGDSADG